MENIARRAGRLAGFVVVPALSLLTPLLVIPLVAHHGGAGAVVAVAVGQSIGFVGSLVVSLAWPMTGPARIARTDDGARASVYTESIDSRALVFVVVAPLGGALALVLTPAFAITAMLSVVALTTNGFTAAWYYAGVGRPRGLLLFEALVRVGSAGVAAALLALGAPVVSYPLVLCAGAALSYVLNYRHVVGRVDRPRLGIETVRIVRSQARMTGARLVNGAYQAAAVSIVAAVAPAAVLTFSAYDRTQKSLMLASQSVTDAVISWVAAPRPGLRRRQRLVLAADLGVAVSLGALFYLGLPLVLGYMYAGLITIDSSSRALAALGLAAAVVAKGVLAHALIPSGLERVASALLTTTSVVGLATTVAGAALLGVHGALAAVVVAEVGFVLVGMSAWTGVRDVTPVPVVAEATS